MDAVTHLAPTVGIVAACDFLGVARASFYRQRPVLDPPASSAPEPALPSERPVPARSLSPAGRAGVLAVFHEERFQDRSPAAVQATLLDEGQYLCSTRTMYRIPIKAELVETLTAKFGWSAERVERTCREPWDAAWWVLRPQ